MPAPVRMNFAGSVAPMPELSSTSGMSVLKTSTVIAVPDKAGADGEQAVRLGGAERDLHRVMLVALAPRSSPACCR